MYQTVLRSVNGYTAIGANGEKLQFVGNWYGKAGDTVWTDGNIIFGHSPLRASSMMISPANSGIPVLCDNLRGYFSPAGTWSDYDIAQKDWIVNNENYFFSGSDSNVKDAAISDKGDLYLATGGEYAEYQQISRNDYCKVRILSSSAPMQKYYKHDTGGWFDVINYFSKRQVVIEDGGVYSFGIDSNDRTAPVEIYKNNELISTLDLSSFVKDLHSKFRDFPEKLEEANRGLHYNIYCQDEGLITSLTVRVYGLSLDKEGKLNYHIFGNVYGYFELNVVFGSLSYQKEFVDKTIGWSGADVLWFPYGFSCLYTVNQEKINSHSYGNLQTTGNFPQDAVAAISYKSDGHHVGESVKKVEVNIDFSTQSESSNIVLPLDNGYCSIDKYGLVAFYDTDSKLIASNVIVDEDYCYVEVDHYDAGKDGWDIFEGFVVAGRQLIVNYKIYTPDGKITEKKADLSTLDTDVDADGIPLMDGYYTRDANGALVPFCFKPLLKKLSDNVYLFGTHGGKLYIKTKSGIQEIGDGLKNFRLEVLNDISKAKG